MFIKRDSYLIRWDINLLSMIQAYAKNVHCHLSIALIPFNANVATDGTINSAVT